MPIKLTTISGAKDAALHIKTASGVVPAALWLKTATGVVLISGSGYDIYVDSVSGSDANDGTTPGKAFATLSAARTAALAIGNGVSIGLTAGSRWREDLDLSALSGITISAVGEGQMPIIDGSRSLSNGDLTQNGTYPSVYQTTVMQTMPEAYLSVWEDDQILKWETSLASCASTPGTFYVSGPSASSGKSAAGSQIIYIHASDGSDCRSNGRGYDVTDPTRQGALTFGTGTVSHIHTRRNSRADGSLVGAGTVIGCVMSDGVKHNALLTHGEYRGCVGWHRHTDVRTGCISLEFYKSDGTGYECLYTDCVVVGNARSSTLGGAVSAYGGHNQGDGTYYDRVTINRCSAEDVSVFIGSTANDGGATACYAHNVEGFCGLSIKEAPSVAMTDMWLHLDASWMVSVRGFTSAIASLTLDGLRAYIGASPSFDGVFLLNGDVTFTKSVIVMDCDKSWSTVAGGGTGGGTVSMQETVVDLRKNNCNVYDWYPVGGMVRGYHANNVYYDNAGSLSWTIDGVKKASPTAYLSAYPESGTSLSNPGVTDPASGNFALASPPNSAGLERLDVSYTPIPSTLSDAITYAWSQA